MIVADLPGANEEAINERSKSMFLTINALVDTVFPAGYALAFPRI